MTYLEVYQSAVADVKVFAPQLTITSLNGLVWTSEALHDYQVQTGVARSTCIIELDPTSTDGHYDLDSDIDVIDKVEYYATADNNYAQPEDVNIFDFDAFQVLKGQSGVPGFNAFGIGSYPYSGSVPVTAVLPGDRPSNYYITRYGDCELYFWPFSGTTGNLKIWYKPYLMPYSPSASGRWKSWGNPPDDTMAITQIPREFNAAYSGIKAYVMAKIIESIPGYQRMFPGKIEMLMRQFEMGVGQITKRHQAMDTDVRVFPRTGAVG